MYNKDRTKDKRNLIQCLDLENTSDKAYLSFDKIERIIKKNSAFYNKHLDSIYKHQKIYNKSGDDLDYPKLKNINISIKVDNLNDLINIIEKNPISKNCKYNIDLYTLNNIKSELIMLNNMIGLNSLKSNIINQILYYVQNLHSYDNNSDFMHIVLYGPPGTGKTEIAQIISQIFCKLGILTKKSFKKVTRADLVAGYLGQTALKTKNVIEESLDGVLFIDEAYALGNSEKRDSFSKECLDTLCEALSNYKNRLMVIIAGYEEELNNCFFSYNSGLESRFIWRYKIEKYSSTELKLIFLKKIKEINWSINIKDDKLEEWFIKYIDKFKYFGRSIEDLITKVKIVHAKRIFGLSKDLHKVIELEDLDNGIKNLIIKQDDRYIINHLYT